MEFRILKKKIGIEKQIDDFLDKVSESGLLFKEGAEAYLKGKPVTEDSLTEAGKIAAGESRVRDSIRGVAWYRREMVGVLVKRMGLLALERAKGMEHRG